MNPINCKCLSGLVTAQAWHTPHPIHAAVTVVVFLLCASAGVSATIRLVTSPADVTTIRTQDIMLVQGQADGIKIVAEEASYRGHAGEPDIAWQLITALLPPNANLGSLSLQLENAQFETLSGTWNIEPTPPMGTRDPDNNPILLWPPDKRIQNGRDVEIYEADAFWPTDGPRLVHSGRLDQWQLVEVAVPLVRYNPVTGQVDKLVAADIAVHAAHHAQAFAEANPVVRRQLDRTGREARLRGRDRVRGLAVNYRAAAGQYDTVARQADETSLYQPASAEEGHYEPAGANSKGYVIITTSQIVNNSNQLANFVTHKQARGWTVSVITENTWGGGIGTTGAVNLRNWLRANYISMDILYVLLIGNPHPDTGDMPMRWYDDGRDGGAPTDAMYSDLSTANRWDKYWEVIVGRIPTYGTMSLLDNILQKTINYENSQNVMWRYNVLMPMVPLDDVTPSYQCGEQIRSHLLIPNNITSTRIYDENYGVNPEYIRSHRYPATEWRSQPYGLVVWQTHGSQTSAQYVVNTSNVSTFNDNYPSATYQGSCQNAWPENSNNLAYRILQRGGINTVAGTRNTFYDVRQTNFAGGGSIGTLAYRYTRAMVNHRQSTGMALANAKQQDYIYPPNATRMTTYGDPSLVIFADPDFTPPQPDPMAWDVEPYHSGPGQVTMVAATAVDNAGADVQYLFQCVSGGGHNSGWQSSSTYTDTQVTQLVSSYRVKARDTSDNLNETEWSETVEVTIAPYPYLGHSHVIPGKIQAQHFDGGGQDVTYHDTTPGNSGGQFRTREDVDIVAITDGRSDYAVDNIETGEWLLYTVNSTAAETDFYARIASTEDGGQILIWLDEDLIATVDVPNTGSLTAWQTISASCQPLPDRDNATVKIEFVGTGFRLNWFQFGNQMPYLGVPFELPGQINFVDFDIGGQQISYFDNSDVNGYGRYRPDEPVDIMQIGSDYFVFAEGGEWLEYTCNIEPGYYTLVLRNSVPYGPMQTSLSIDGQTLAQFALPSSGGFTLWQDTVIPTIYLSGGPEQQLRVSLLTATAVLDSMTFIREYNSADISETGRVGMDDFALLAAQWLGAPGVPSADIAPLPDGDGVVDVLDLLMLAENWLME